jgi:hypothetical protein
VPYLDLVALERSNSIFINHGSDSRWIYYASSNGDADVASCDQACCTESPPTEHGGLWR